MKIINAWVVTCLLAAPQSAAAEVDVTETESTPTESDFVAPAPSEEPVAEQAPNQGKTVIYVSTDGLSPAQVHLLEQAIVRRMKLVEGISPVLAVDGVENTQCTETATNCLAAIAEGMGTPWALHASVRTVADTEVVTLKNMNLISMEVTKSVTKSVDIELGALRVIGDALDELYGQVEIAAGEPWNVPLTVTDHWQTKPVPRAVFFAAAGVTAASLAVAAGLRVRANRKNDEFQALARQGTQTPVPGDLLLRLGDEGTRAEDASRALFITTGALATATLITAIFTEFRSPDAAFSPTLWVGNEASAGLGFTGEF